MDINQYIISEDMPIKKVMEVINERLGANLFVCADGILCASVSDGDIRRYILNAGDLREPVSKIANYRPIYFHVYDDIAGCRQIMEKNGINAIPIVDRDMKLVRIEFLNKRNKIVSPLNVPVVIMAGGKGTRLRPYTQILPKPLIPIGNLTITEQIMKKFEAYSCFHFDMIINYKKNLIRSYFQDSETKHDVTFIDEPEFWGTAGGLNLIKGKYHDTFFVTNCDILVEIDYSDFYRYHKAHRNIISLVCAKKKTMIPYGTVSVNENGYIEKLNEKPELEFLTNTGLYLIEPEFLNYIPANTFIHITDVVQRCIEENKNVGAYIIEDNNWMDMGQPETLEQMQNRLYDSQEKR